MFSFKHLRNLPGVMLESEVYALAYLAGSDPTAGNKTVTFGAMQP